MSFRIIYIACALMLSFLSTQAQLGSWSHRQTIIFHAQQNTNPGVFQTLLYLDTQSPISQGLMEADGRDIRFADSCGLKNYPYWIEDGLNTDSTRIWVQIDDFIGLDSLPVYLFHGHPSANSTSSFNLTFPNQIISGGSSIALGGQVNTDWLEIGLGDTLYLTGGATLRITAGKIKIDGTIMGSWLGYPIAPNLGNSGNGPQAGNGSPNAGAGGAGYGGTGGTGGYDLGDIIGIGGMTTGTQNGADIAPGSSGGNSALKFGGAGGGGLELQAHHIEINGRIHCDGASAEQPSGSLGGGGGAGGGILARCRRLSISNGLTANGGAGGAGSQSSNDDGGGGGGGRIKLFWEDEFMDSGFYHTYGGSSGPNGSAAPGQPGTDGTFTQTTQAYPFPYYQTSPSQTNPLPGDAILIPDPTPICPDEVVTFSMPLGYSNYIFKVNNTLKQDSSWHSYTSNSLAQNAEIVSAAVYGACTMRDTYHVALVPAPVLDIQVNNLLPCTGDTVALHIGPGWQEIIWSTQDTSPQILVTTAAVYHVTALDSNACQGSDTISINVNALPFPQIVKAGFPACEGETYQLTTNNNFSTYLWSTGAQTMGIYASTSGSFAVTVTNVFGCENSTQTTIAMDSIPKPGITYINDTLSTDPIYSNYQWYLNGVPIFGSNSADFGQPFPGVYTLQVTSSQGCEGYSSDTLTITSRPSIPDRFKLRLFPNPSSTAIYLEAEVEPGKKVWISLLNIHGKLISRTSIQPHNKVLRSLVDLSPHPLGAYILRIEQGEIRENFKIWKQ